jgi:N-acetylmuramoyl-L-alanine amidase
VEPANPAEGRVPLPASKPRAGGSSLVRALGLKLERVVIDPGHGGHDTGTIGRAGLTEKDLVLDVARRLGTLIEERLGAEVIYTRTEDVFVPLEERTALANEKKADLFLSIHGNAGVRSAAGSETYYLNFTTSKTAMEVAARENASSQRSIHELQGLIEKIALKDKVEESREFAARVQTALVRELARSNNASRDRGVRKAPFVVLIGAAMPSVLSEIAFLSNPQEEKLLKREDYRQKIAEGLYKGLSQYASTLSRFQVAEKGKSQK